jgi:hypothetical protein
MCPLHRLFCFPLLPETSRYYVLSREHTAGFGEAHTYAYCRFDHLGSVFNVEQSPTESSIETSEIVQFDSADAKLRQVHIG